MNSEEQNRIRISQRAASIDACVSGIRVVALLVILLLCASGSSAYSVLTHEEIVDLVWTTQISPLLL
ncbi:MAG TPA: hypothetical protein VKH63_17570, partial [Candidatus Acidoferrum sp.]|nr:hypothetical protein [Candidatus Acidoferrum sp.]